MFLFHLSTLCHTLFQSLILLTPSNIYISIKIKTKIKVEYLYSTLHTVFIIYTLLTCIFRVIVLFVQSWVLVF